MMPEVSFPSPPPPKTIGLYLLEDPTTACEFFEARTRADPWTHFSMPVSSTRMGAPGLRGVSAVFSSHPNVQHGTWHRADFLYEFVEWMNDVAMS